MQRRQTNDAAQKTRKRYRIPVAAVVTVGLIACVATTYLVYVWPLMMKRHGVERMLAHFAAGAVLLVSILYFYLATLATRMHSDSSSTEETGTILSEFCDKCNCWRQAGTHHCSRCKRCIPGMDHHCLAMDTCVGHHNRRFYCAFLVCLSCGCMFYAISVIHLLRGLSDSEQPFLMIVTFVLTAAVGGCLLPLIAFHGVLLVLGMTTIDALRYWEIG